MATSRSAALTSAFRASPVQSSPSSRRTSGATLERLASGAIGCALKLSEKLFCYSARRLLGQTASHRRTIPLSVKYLILQIYLLFPVISSEYTSVASQSEAARAFSLLVSLA